MQRYFINQNLEDNIIIIDSEILHHVGIVMRNRSGDQIGLINNGVDVIYDITSISKDEIYLKKAKVQNTRNPELKINVDFAIGFLKKDNFELAIQKLSECGVNNIIPVNFIRSVVKVDDKKWPKKKKRYEAILKSASMQSQRNKIPTLSDIKTLKSINYSKYDLVITCYEKEEAKLLTKINNDIINSNNILVIIGPEGGLDIQEVDYLNELDNNQTVTLGNRILRAETAIISSMFLISMLIESEKIKNSL